RTGCKPQILTLQCATSPEAIGEPSRDPSSHGGDQQRGGSQYSCLSCGDATGSDQRWYDKAIHLDVHCIQNPSANTCSERPAFSRAEFRDPCQTAAPSSAHGTAGIRSHSKILRAGLYLFAA